MVRRLVLGDEGDVRMDFGESTAVSGRLQPPWFLSDEELQTAMAAPDRRCSGRLGVYKQGLALL